MNTINIQDIYRVQPQIDMACELLYICELGKAFSQVGLKGKAHKLSIKGLTFADTLKESPFWSYFCKAIKEGWLVDADENIKLNAANMLDSKRVQDITIMPKTDKATKTNE